MNAELKYRLFNDTDLPEVLRLWEIDGGWGELSADAWHQTFMSSPYGPALVTVAVDHAERIAGQMFFTPTRVQVGTLVLRALRISAPVLRGGFRRVNLRSLDHPVLQMLFLGFAEATRQGYDVAYGHPHSAWFSILPLWLDAIGRRSAIAQFQCLARPIEPSPSDDLYAQPRGSRDSEFDDLWQCAKSTYPISCGIVRSADWLDFAYPTSRHSFVEVRRRREDSLAGYAVIRNRDGLVMDLLARSPDEATSVLSAAIDWIAAQRQVCSDGLPSNVSAMKTTATEPVLSKLSFRNIDFRFTFFCTHLSDNSSMVVPPPQGWYLTPGD